MLSAPTISRNATLDRIADECVIRAGVAPQAAVGWAARTGSAWCAVLGASGGRLPGWNSAMGPEAPFDLASITKPFVALAAARLVARGLLNWEDELRRWVPQLERSASADCPLEHMFLHRSGLTAHRDLFEPLRQRRAFSRRSAFQEAADARRRDCGGTRPTGGFPSLYSDLGYLLGGLVLECATGQPLDELVENEVCRPLGVEVASARQWLTRGRKPNDLVPTEHVGWRGGSLQGIVHDENAWAIAGYGIAGHAGLFGTVAGVLRLGMALIEARAGDSDWLTAQAMAHLLAKRPGTTLVLGFDTKSPSSSTAGHLSGSDTFGHLGFTGTSLWCDPDAKIVTALLTNRVRPTRANTSIRAARPLIHDRLYSEARSTVTERRVAAAEH